MPHVSTPTPSHAPATERIDMRALWQLYSSSPPEIRVADTAKRRARDAETVLIRVPLRRLIGAGARGFALTTGLLALAAWGGFAATTRAARDVPVVTTPIAAPSPRAPAVAPPAQTEDERPVSMTIELLDDIPALRDSPSAAIAPTPTVRRAAPKKFHVANEADMAAAARANQASQQALDSSLK
jgi:hypothetical protein